MVAQRLSSLSPEDRREIATLAMRLLMFAATLAIVGAFLLPWVRIDGMAQPSSGAQLVALLATPTVGYLFAVSPMQAAVLIGGPALLIAAALVVVWKYGRRETAPIPTCVVFACSLAIAIGAPDLTSSDGAGSHAGLWLIVALSIALLLHQASLMACEWLYARPRMQNIYETLTVLTGSGYYRWPDGGRP